MEVSVDRGFSAAVDRCKKDPRFKEGRYRGLLTRGTVEVAIHVEGNSGMDLASSGTLSGMKRLKERLKHRRKGGGTHPVGHQSTKRVVRSALTMETAACTSRVATPPRHDRQLAINTTNRHISVDEGSYKDEYAL